MLDGIPKSLPALLRARRLQERAAQVGFEWENLGGPLDKMEEEVREFRQACESQDHEAVEDELGGFLFSLVNVSRYVKADPEAALHRTARKFIRRFQHIEKRAREEGQDLADMKIEEMDRYWDEAKRLDRAGDSQQ